MGRRQAAHSTSPEGRVMSLSPPPLRSPAPAAEQIVAEQSAPLLPGTDRNLF